MIVAFSRICGDKNPVHLDPVYAAKTRFRSPIAHGMTAIALLNSMIPSGKKVQHYEIRFIKPIYPLDKLQAVLEINYEDKFSFLLSKL